LNSLVAVSTSVCWAWRFAEHVNRLGLSLCHFLDVRSLLLIRRTYGGSKCDGRMIASFVRKLSLQHFSVELKCLTSL
jgi:hypothetical protein